MSDERWQAFLLERNKQLEKELGRVRRLLYAQRARTASWKYRALRKSKAKT